jgi:hypothetical protein
LSEFEIAGQTYRVGRLNALNAHNIARKLVFAVLQLAEARKKGGPAPGSTEWSQAFCALTADLPDAVMNSVITTCLSVVARRQGNAFAPVMVADRMMFDDIDMMSMLRLVGHVVEVNGIPDFFTAKDPGSADQTTAMEGDTSELPFLEKKIGS